MLLDPKVLKRASVLLCLALAWACNLLSGWATGPSPLSQEAVEVDSVTHFRAGQEALRNGRMQDAVDEFQKVLRLDPGLVEARVNLGIAYHLLGQYDLAVIALSKALRQKPSLPGPSIFLGIDYLKLGLPAKAIGPLQEALRVEPSNREARRALAACYLAQDKYEQASKEFLSLSSLEPDKERAWFDLGRDYLDMARRLARRMPNKYQASSWAHRLAGDFYSKQHRWNDAAREYLQALDIDPKQRGLHADLGMAYLHQANWDKALAQFSLELDIDPRDERALLGLTEVYLAKGMAESALESISKIWDAFPPSLAYESDFPLVTFAPELGSQLAIKFEGYPESGARSFLLSALYRVAGKSDKAHAQQVVFQSQLETWENGQNIAEPGEIQSGATTREACTRHRLNKCVNFLRSQKGFSLPDSLLLGASLMALGKVRDASDVFAASFEQENGTAETTYWLIQAYMKLADDCFGRLIDIAPECWRAHQLQAETYQFREDYSGAIREYQAAVRLDPENAELHELLGEVFLLDKALAEARPELEESVRLNPTGARSLYLLGQWYVTDREFGNAIPYLQDALRREPDFLEARYFLGKAYLRSGQALLAVRELEKASILDRYGDLHYLLYEGYRKLGREDLAQKALRRSQELRKKAADSAQARLSQSIPDR